MMVQLCLRAADALEALSRREEGQNLVEYALVVALIAFGAMAGMRMLAVAIRDVFSVTGNTLTTNM